MNKVCIIGCPGSGKSTMARKLGEITGFPVYHLDAYFHKRGWVERSQDEWHRILNDLLSEDEWIMDGDYGSSQDMRFAKADTIIFLDFPRYKCMINVLKRNLVYRNKSRPDVAEGCYEMFDLEFYRWIWNFKRRQRLRDKVRLRRLQGEKEIVVLKNHKEIDRFLERIKSDKKSIQASI